MRKTHQHGDDRCRRLILRDRIDEELVDLDRVGAQPLHLGQAAIADANVIHCDPKAEFAQLPHHGSGSFKIGQFAPLSHFQHDLARRYLCTKNHAAKALNEPLAQQVPRRDVE